MTTETSVPNLYLHGEGYSCQPAITVNVHGGTLDLGRWKDSKLGTGERFQHRTIHAVDEYGRAVKLVLFRDTPAS
jgi:hypothetical protein